MQLPAASPDLREQLQRIASLGTSYLQRLETLPPPETRNWLIDPNHYWNQLSDKSQAEADVIERQFLALAKEVVAVCKRSLLIGPAEMQELQLSVKRIRSALRLQNYVFSEGEVVHDEGNVLGYTPPSYSEYALSPQDAVRVISFGFTKIQRIFDLADDQRQDDVHKIVSDGGSRFRRDTAFIMMWMDPKEPALEDVRDAVREVFDSFGIRAVRADDVEHDGMITERIIQEIQTSEFLLADLTGARPSVYYEVGYAHAFGKRVILYRKEGTQIHFDLAGYNCPEYRNIRDLKEKLTKRIEQMTNRRPRNSN
jgi:hypothetical protein